MKSKVMVYFAILGILVLLYAAYSVFLFWSAAQKSKPLIAATPPYTREDPALTKNILILGDSLAVGVGSPGEKTIGGRLSETLKATVENYAKSGAQTSDLAGQMQRAKRDRYDLILIHAGANDVIQLKSLATAEVNMDQLLADAAKKSDRVVFLTSGNIGDAPLWPFPWGYLYWKRTLNLRERFLSLAAEHGALYIDLYARGNLFASDPRRFYAVDDLHLTGDGYGKWFEVIVDEVRTRWPELSR